MSKEQEEYISKDNETKETVKKLWKKFHQLPRDFSIGYAKAVNEIIQEKNLKNINNDNLKMFFKKSPQTNQAVPKNKQSQQLYLSKTPYNTRKRSEIYWRSDQSKKYVQDIRDIDQHININPWNSEMRTRPENQMPVFLKDIQQQIDQKISEKQAEKAKNGNKRQSYQQEFQEEFGQLEQEQEGNVKNQQTAKNRNNRMKCFSIEYLPDLSLLAMGMINRQLQLYFAYHEKNLIQMRRIYAHQFNDCIICIQYRHNIVTKKWNIALLFENNILRIYEFILKNQRISYFEHFFTFEFKIEIDKMKMFNEFGFVLTSYKGEFFIFSDHLTSSNSSEEVKSVPQYYIDQENKLSENGIALSITAMACCEVYKVITFGTSKGKIAFYEVKTREFLGIHEAGDDIILSLHVYKQQKQLISICKNSMITIWDIARRMQIQSLRGIDDTMDVGNAKITSSIFTHEFNQLMVTANSLKIWEMQVNKNLLFKERKMQQLYEWRKKDMEKQDNYLLIEGVKGKQQQTPEKKKTTFNQCPKKGLICLKNTVQEKKKVYTQTKELTIIRQAIITKDVIVTWNSVSEIRIICSKKYKLKYSFMLSAPEEDKIVFLDILDDKILAMCTEKGDIYIKNLYTEDLCQKIGEYENYPLKLNILLFLPSDCQMFLAASSLEGKVMFFNSYLKKKTSKKYISINAHNKDVISMITNNYTTMLSAGIDNVVNIYSLRSCSSLYRIDFSTLASKQYIFDMCIQKEKTKEKEKNMALIVLERGQIYELNCNDGMIISAFKEVVGQNSRCNFDSQNKFMISVDEELTLKIYEKTLFEQAFSKHFSMNFNVGQSPVRFDHNFNNSQFHYSKGYGKQLQFENEKWNSQPKIIYYLKEEPIFSKIKDPELACVKIIFDDITQQFYIFLNQVAIVLVNISNPKELKMRMYFYSTGELSEYQRLSKPEEISLDSSSQIDLRSDNSLNLI